MSNESPNPYQAGGRLTQAELRGSPEQIQAARANLAEARIAHAIQKNLATAPPLSKAQLARLRGLLRGAK